MRRYFNTEAVCVPDKHYMVRLDERIKRIKEQYVDRGFYFIINCGRQYGKTTTLKALEKYLKEEYCVVFLDFQGIGAEEFTTEAVFAEAFSQMFAKELFRKGLHEKELAETFLQGLRERATLRILFEQLSALCEKSSKPVVLLIDEVDSASNNQVFIDFLALIRKYYINRESSPAFQSVILAGVYDIKNLKLKLRPEIEHKYNSPWNIAAKFSIPMGFSVRQIVSMLQEYEHDFRTGMNVDEIAGMIYEYTSGYPYLVSAICKQLDEELPYLEAFEEKNVWSCEGVETAVGMMLNESIPLFESMFRQLQEYPDLKKMLYSILFEGKGLSYNRNHPVINLASMFGYIVNNHGDIQVANRIFETCLYNYFLSEEEFTNEIYNKAQGNCYQFIHGEKLDMDLVVEKFVTYFTEIYGDNDEKFVEEYGRKFFLLYLKPIINGTGHYYIEARTRDARRTDVIVDYYGNQFIIEMKIWHGNEYNERGEAQLADYLDAYNQKKGYMISFNFNKNKQIGIRQIQIGDKTIVEAVL